MDCEFNARIVKGGRVVWARPGAAKAFFESLEGRRVKIIVEEPTRTKAENRLFHALFNELSERTGETPGYWKDLLKALYCADLDRGTSGMTISEASDFIEFCLYFAAENLGIIL